MATVENNPTSSSTDNVEFGRNTMCHFLSSFFRSLTRVTDVQQEKFFNSINQIVINTPSVFVTDADKQHTFDEIRTTNSYYFDVYIVSLLIWTLSSKKFCSIQENTIGVLANLYGELSLRWPSLFRIFIIELIDTLNDTIKYDIEFIEEDIHQPKRLNRFVIPDKAASTFSTNVTIERCNIEFNCSDDISSFQLNLISVLKHLSCTLSTLLNRQTISILIGTLCELIRTADLNVKSASFSFLSSFIEHRSLGLLIDDLAPYVHFSLLDILLTIMNFIHTEPKHSIELENDFSHFIRILCRNHDESIEFFAEHIGFIIPRLKELIIHVGVVNKSDVEFHVNNNRPLKYYGEVQTELYLEQFSLWLAILFECGQNDIGTSSLLVIHAYELVEHLLANLDECLLAKFLNRSLAKVITWLLQEKNRTLQQPFRVRRIRLLKTIWQHLKLTLEKTNFNNDEDALQGVFNVYCLITSICQAYISCQMNKIKFESIDENDFYLSWLTIDELSVIYGYLINTLVYLINSVNNGLFSVAYEYILATIVATSVYISDQLDVRLREDILSILCLSWLSTLNDWHDFQPTTHTCKITKQLAQTFQTKFNQNDRLISLKCLALFNSEFYPSLRLHIFLTCLNHDEINTQLTALQVLPFMQYNLQTTSFLSVFYKRYCTSDIDNRLKTTVMNIWRLHRCLWDIENRSVQFKIDDNFDKTILNSFELICTSCSSLNNKFYIQKRINIKNTKATQFSLYNILPIFDLFNQTSIECNYLSLMDFFQTFNFHSTFIRPKNENDEHFVQLKYFFNKYLNQNNHQERLCLLSIMPYLFKTIFISNKRQWETSVNDCLDQFLFDTLTQLNNDAIRQTNPNHDDDYSRLIHLSGLIARRTCNEDIFVFVLFFLINALSTSFQHTSQIELMHIAKDEYLIDNYKSNKDKNLLTLNDKIDLTPIVQQHTESLYRLISQSLLLNSEQPSDICLRHLHLLFSMMQQNGSSFNTYLKRILPDLLPWIVEERSLNASRVVQHIRTAVKMSKKKVIFDAFPAIYSHVWRHVRLANNQSTSGDYSINRVYEVNEFIEQEAGADLAAVFRFGGPPIFSKLLLYISTHPDHVLRGLQMAVAILDGVLLPVDKDYSTVVPKENVHKALQSKLLGILCDFESELLSNHTPLQVKKRVLLSLIEVLKIMEPAQIVATRVKLLRSLRLALQCSSELSLIVFNLWTEFISHLSTNIDILLSMILQLTASLLPFYDIDPEHFQELILLMLSTISNNQIALIADDLLLIPQINQIDKIKHKLNKCKNQHDELIDNQNKSSNDQRSSLENKFQRLITLLNFDMVDIRLHALNSVQNLLKTNRSYLLQLCLSRDTVPPIITRLLLTLLERSNDSNQKIRFTAIDCLAEIGAIDPGRIEFRKFYSQIATSTSLINRLLSNPNSELANDDLKRCYFNLYSQEFALELFSELTRAFLSADQVRQQDTISYAIQECLKFYNLNLSDENEKTKINQNLWSKLNQEQQDLFKPLRTSKYVLTDETNLKGNKSQDAILKQLTIKTYEQWLTQYVPYLIQHLPTNNYYHLFHSCLFAVRFNSSIGAFLLPYIILHLIGENLGQDVLDKEIKALIFYTNHYDSNEIPPSSDVLHQIAQIMFTLTDFLLLFSSLNTIDPNEQAKLNQRKRQQQANQEPLNIQDGTWNNLGIIRVRDYIRLLHTDLSLARIAFKYDHYTRAYRHFEMYSTTEQQINVCQHSEFLLKLFHRLNDQDSAYGIIAIRDMTPKQQIENNSTRTNIYEEILSYELTGQIDEAIVAYENALERNELNQTNIHLYLGYLNTLLTQQQFQHTIDQSTGIIVQYPAWKDMLNPLRIEASWKLSKWNLLDKFCSYDDKSFNLNQTNEQTNDISNMNILHDLNVSKQFEEYLGKILCQAKKRNQEKFYYDLNSAYQSLMGPISAASMEVGSYQRAYDYLVKLHLLKDLEYYVLKNVFNDDESIMIVDNEPIDDIWSQRHALLPPNSRYIEPSLALRRTILLLDDKNDNKQHTSEIGECWLHSARIARTQNNSLAAIGSLMKASQTHSIEVAIERAQWMWDKGEKDRAIMSLKQKKIELLDSRTTTNETNHIDNRLPVSADLKAQLWLLLARYSEQNSPHEAVFEMYKQAQEAGPHWEETHFYLAQFYDTLLSSSIESDPTSSNSTSTTTTNNFLSSTGLSLESKIRMMEYIRLAVNTYCRSLKYGCEFIYQSLTRLLTMWLDFASDLVPFIKPVQAPAASRKQQSLMTSTTNLPDIAQIKQHGQAKLAEITRDVSTWTTRVPSYIFLAAFPYMVSRICHSEDMTSKALNAIITQVFAAFPQQTLWMMINLYGSSNSMRRDRCIAIWNEAAHIEPGLHDFVVEATILIKQLDTLCMHAVTYGQNKISLSAQFKSFKRSYANQSACPILIPIQSQMQVSLPPPPVRFSLSATTRIQQQTLNVDLPSDAAAKLTAMANKQGPLGRPTTKTRAQTGSTLGTNKPQQKTYYDPRHQPFPDSVITIHSFEDTIEVLSSLQRPKKIIIRGSDGQLYPFLCKSQDDLRVDSRCLDFCHLFNKCLKKNSETRRRQLNIRTYAVYPINERCGLIEWLPNLCTFRSLVTKFYRQRSANFSEVSNREIKVYGNNKDKSKEARYNDFLKLLAFHQPTVFHQYFFAAYPDPNRWYMSRMNFVRSTAVMSMIGYIMGLGDRHCENILIDTCTGETVHVDFNCLFNKGLTFEIPEKVPFRLTHNIVDGMGTLGVEGVFRKTCEIILHLIRDERELLVSVLKTFIYDPLVEWKSATREEVANMKKQQIEGGEVVNIKAQTHVRNILERVRGYCTDELTGKRVVLPLSVEGQVDHLIRQATSNELLCQMFIGWAAYL